MRKREREIRDRFWLKMRRFAITKSLKAKLASQTDLTDRQREYCCYIQNKILRETREQPTQFANIGARYWSDKCGSGYRRWIDLLVEWGELLVLDNYRKGTSDEPGFTKRYRIPANAWKAGVTKIVFNRRATAIRDHTELKDADDIIRYVHKCSSRLTVPKALVDIFDPIRDAASHEFSRRVFWGDFNVRYGNKCGRMFHSIIEMPKEARRNLVFKHGGPPLFEYDVQSCHPVLLLGLFTDPLERAKFSVVLDHDVYSTIRAVTGVPEDRDWVKVQFMVCTNAIDRYVAGRREVVYRFFQEYFPVFTREVLDNRSDLAVELQRQESQIMVQGLGRFCMERNIFWIPCHDGWMGVEEGESEILKKVGEEFLNATGYPVRIKKAVVGNDSIEVSTHIPSYVCTGPTSVASNGYKKSAEEWFANLPKHPEPDAEMLLRKQHGRQRRRAGFRASKRRALDSERIRNQIGPLWNNHRAKMDGEEAA